MEKFAHVLNEWSLRSKIFYLFLQKSPSWIFHNFLSPLCKITFPKRAMYPLHKKKYTLDNKTCEKLIMLVFVWPLYQISFESSAFYVNWQILKTLRRYNFPWLWSKVFDLSRSDTIHSYRFKKYLFSDLHGKSIVWKTIMRTFCQNLQTTKFFKKCS